MVRPIHDWTSDDDLIWSQCMNCKWELDDGNCKAFPNGIPEAILGNDHDHREPYPGDNGILFERKPEGPYFRTAFERPPRREA